jgi:glycosyltransferase involved in cell wall biosynthesis
LEIELPKRVLYATSARLGGFGLDNVACEIGVGLFRAGCLGRIVAYANRQTEIPSRLVRSLRWHPVRLLSWVGRDRYYGAKKHYLDWIAAGELSRGGYDLFHGWSGECLSSLRIAKARGIPTVIEAPTWHRDKGKVKPRLTKSERERLAWRGPRRWMESLKISRQAVLEEYDLADVIVIQSEKSEETFLAAGVPREKLYRHVRGVDPDRFFPGEKPEKFRAIFLGALIERKGVHHLLEAWHRLGLEDAELLLVGVIHKEMEPWIERFPSPTVRFAGFAEHPETLLRQASVHIFPSTCEGSAKVTVEAAACGLPQIATREAGDVVRDGVNGLVVPAADPAALAEAIGKLYREPETVRRMGEAARRIALENYTWDLHRERVFDAYRLAVRRAGVRP